MRAPPPGALGFPPGPLLSPLLPSAPPLVLAGGPPVPYLLSGSLPPGGRSAAGAVRHHVRLPPRRGHFSII